MAKKYNELLDMVYDYTESTALSRHAKKTVQDYHNATANGECTSFPKPPNVVKDKNAHLKKSVWFQAISKELLEPEKEKLRRTGNEGKDYDYLKQVIGKYKKTGNAIASQIKPEKKSRTLEKYKWRSDHITDRLCDRIKSGKITEDEGFEQLKMLMDGKDAMAKKLLKERLQNEDYWKDRYVDRK